MQKWSHLVPADCEAKPKDDVVTSVKAKHGVSYDVPSLYIIEPEVHLRSAFLYMISEYFEEYLNKKVFSASLKFCFLLCISFMYCLFQSR